MIVALSPPPEHGWIHVIAVRALVHRTSAVVAALLMFGLVGYLIRTILDPGPLKKIVLWIDEIILVLLLLYFAWGLVWELVSFL